MNLFSVVERILLRLSTLPGLGFLSGYVTEFYGRSAQIRSTIDRHRGYVTTIRGAGADIADAASGSKVKDEEEDGGDEIEDEEPDDFESFMQ